VQRSRRVIVYQRRTKAIPCFAVSAAGGEFFRCDPATGITNHSRRQHDRGKRYIEREDPKKRRSRYRPQYAVLQGARTNAISGKQYDGGDRRLDTVENSRHRRHVAEGEINPRQEYQDEQRRQHEQRTCDDTTPRSVHQPADVNGKLLRLRSRKHHAVIERVQKSPLRDPAFFLDQVLVL